MAPHRYKTYPSYKDSAVKWLGEIPSSWDVRRLKDIASVRMSNVDKKTVEGELPVELCNYVDVYYNEHISSSLEFMPATATAEQVRRFALAAGDVLITKDSESWDDIAVSAVVAETLPNVLCGYHLALVRPGQNVDGAFLARAFSAVGPRDQFRVAANGITRFGLTADAITTSVFPVPPKHEQRVIAAFLDRATAKIDALVAKKEQLLKLLEEKRTALITQAVTKGLDPKVPMVDSGVEWLGGIPAHWSVLPLKRVSSIRYGLGEPPQGAVDGLPLIRATNVSRGEIVDRDLALVDPRDVPWSRDPVLRTDDIIVVRSGAYTGDSAIVPERYDGAIAGYDLVVKPKGVVPRFLSWVLLSRYVLDSQVHLQSLRAAQPHLNAEELGSVVVLLPPSSEQRAILMHVDEQTREVKTLTAKTLDAIACLRELRTALISAAVTGKVDVREPVA